MITDIQVLLLVLGLDLSELSIFLKTE